MSDTMSAALETQEAVPLRICVADDSSTVRKFITMALNDIDTDIEITEAADGKEAVKLLISQSFDIVFLDINMPHINGVEVMGALHEKGSKTFAVAMSDSLSNQSAEMLKSFGAYDFLTKPFSKNQIRQVVETFETINMPFDVLVVDDSTTVRRIVLKVLQRSIFNLNVVEASDGAGALAEIAKQPYRVIFTDFNMPNMTGVELAERLAEVARGSDVILMSTEYSESLDTAALKVGAKAFLRKPFYPDDVDSILHHLFGLRHSAFSKQVRVFAMT